MNTRDLKVALVHDFLNQYGGAEKVLEVFGEMFPEAPIYTIIYDKKKMRGKFFGRDIRASFFQKWPKFFRRRIKYFLPLFPTVPETFDLREFDLVISSSGAWSKGIVTRLNTTHIAYVHSPMRFVWDSNERYLKEERKEKLGFIIRPVLSYFRLWDRLAADRPDYLIANSKYTQARIKKYYRRESEVIYPPVNFKFRISNFELNHNFKNSNLEIESKLKIQNSKFFLIISRLSAYKKIDTVIEAFNKLELPLVIVGEGKEEKRLRAMANKNIKFLGWQPDDKLPGLYSGAKALISASVEDFGLSMAEAMASGIPVISIKKGGAEEIVEEGKTGEFFESATPEVLADAVRRFSEKETAYDREYIKQRAERFGKERFKKEMNEFITHIAYNMKHATHNK